MPRESDKYCPDIHIKEFIESCYSGDKKEIDRILATFEEKKYSKPRLLASQFEIEGVSMSPAGAAKKGGHEDIVHFLSSISASRPHRKYSKISEDDSSFAEKLAAQKADQAKDREGLSLPDAAKGSGKDLLARQMAALDKVTAGESAIDGSRYPLHYAIWNRKQIEQVKSDDPRYEEHINLQDSNKETPLHVAVRAGSLSWVEHLIELGADPTITNNQDFSALGLSESLLEPRTHSTPRIRSALTKYEEKYEREPEDPTPDASSAAASAAPDQHKTSPAPEQDLSLEERIALAFKKRAEAKRGYDDESEDSLDLSDYEDDPTRSPSPQEGRPSKIGRYEGPDRD